MVADMAVAAEGLAQAYNAVAWLVEEIAHRVEERMDCIDVVEEDCGIAEA